jgi:hypothetical protein
MRYNQFIELVIFRKETGLPMLFQDRLIQFVVASLALYSFALADDPTDLKSIRGDLASLSIQVVDQRIEELTDEQAGKVVSDLVAIVDSGRHPVAWTAINRLARTNINQPSEQTKAIKCFVKQLDHTELAYRMAATDGLIHLGQVAIDHVEPLLESQSHLQRSAAIVILDRLKAIGTDKLTALMQDPSPRIRYAALEAMKHPLNSVDTIIPLVEDKEAAIALRAMAIVSQQSRELKDSSKVITALSKALGREVLKKDACIALARLGKRSQIAIPSIIRASPEGTIRDFGFDDVGEVAINHIGPADLGALDELIELLGSENLTTRLLAAKAIAQLGPAASKAAPKLFGRATQDLRLLVEQRKKEKEDDDRRQVLPNYYPSVDACTVAYYRVSEDIEMLLPILDEGTVYFADYNFFAHESTRYPDRRGGDCLANRLVVACLERLNKNSSLQAIERLAHFVQPDVALSVRMFDALKSATVEEQKTIAAILAGSLSANTPEHEATMCQLAESKVLGQYQFIAVARRLQFRSQSTLDFLERALKEENEFPPTEVVSAWMELSPDQDRATKFLLDESHYSRRAICESTVAIGIYNEMIVDFLGEVLSDQDYWTKFYAIQALGKGKSQSKSQSARLSSLLSKTILKSKNETRELEFALRIALFQIERDRDILTPMLANLKDMDVYTRRSRLKSIAELGPDALPWLDQVLEEMERVIDTREADLPEDANEYKSWMELALRTTSDKAGDRVVELQNSEDALISDAAKEVMRRFENSRPGEKK